MKRPFLRPLFIRIFNWEYWPFHAIYLFLYPVWLLFSLRARSFFFFAAANPRITNGGFTNESKKEIYFGGPIELFPQSVFFDVPCSLEEARASLDRAKMDYPLVAKPDIGARGQGVMMLKNDSDLLVFLQKINMPFHIQEFISYPLEVGIFYCRIPGSPSGWVTGVVRKEFLHITGDGIHTVDELMQQHPRAVVYLQSMRSMHQHQLSRVLSAGEKMLLSPYGNHSRGALFLDDRHLIDQALVDFMNELCSRIPEFYYGRLDIRFADWEGLKRGEQFRIIEVNGAGAEPTHMYDPRHSFFFAWKEIVRHWYYLLRISMKNHKQGHRYLTWKEGVAMLREEKQWSARLRALKE